MAIANPATLLMVWAMVCNEDKMVIILLWCESKCELIKILVLLKLVGGELKSKTCWVKQSVNLGVWIVHTHTKAREANGWTSSKLML